MSTAPQPSAGRFDLDFSSRRTDLRDAYHTHFQRIQRDFEKIASGSACVADRTSLVERILVDLWKQAGTPGALLAIGGFGRAELFPHSDVDLLFLYPSEADRDAAKSAVRALCQTMWDVGMRVSPVVRTVAECAGMDLTNPEFMLSLLDSRYLAGDIAAFKQLKETRLPEMVLRDSGTILQALTELTQARHRRFGDTSFHQEPNLKDGPGGLRDLHVARWVKLIQSIIGKECAETLGHHSSTKADDLQRSFEFLASSRCYLHFRSQRDDNAINWTAQEELAQCGIATGCGPVSPAEWMRLYFRHAKFIDACNSQLLREVAIDRSSLLRAFQRWRSRFSNTEFSVVNGQVYFQQAADAKEAGTVLRLFVFLARHGLALGPETEQRIRSAHRRLLETMPQDQGFWQYLREILALPHAAAALRAMHALGLLNQALPEFEAIDVLVLRDLYHRYTVDEHTFRAIDTLHGLRESTVECLQPFRELFQQVDRPELLLLALLLHDVGKGLEGDDHVQSSVQLTRGALARLQLPAEERETVLFLVAAHLEISSTLRRRDIFDPATIRELAAKMGTPERLKMLTLVTLADISAVNQDALTAWKAENLWRLYMGAAAYFDRSADERLQISDAGSDHESEKILALLPNRRDAVATFLDGLSHRYLLSNTPEEVAQHFVMADHLAAEPVQLELRSTGGQQELTLVTGERPGLFCTMAGILYAWGMDITRAAAFSNRAGVVVDSFSFKDRFRTLELNPSERERLKRSVREILRREAPLDPLLQSRMRADLKPVKLTVETRLLFNNECSQRSTLLEVVTQDRPGLLHTISSVLANESCSIEIALIHTEGPLAHDVFYLTRQGQKLSDEQRHECEWALSAELGDSLPADW